MVTKKIFLRLLAGIAIFMFLVSPIYAISLSELRIIASDGTFLGTFEDEYSQNSIYNRYGRYGSKYNSNCILNKYDRYGDDYSNTSPFNRYATAAPGLYDRQGNFYGTLSINRYASGVTQYSYNLAIQLKAYRDSL
jgi:hypothetical protein